MILGNIASYELHSYEGANHSSDLLLSSTSPNFQASLRNDESKKQSFEMQNEYEKDIILPFTYSELPQCKSSSTESSSHLVEPGKDMSMTDNTSINKNSISFHSDNIANKTITSTSYLDELNGANSIIQNESSDKMSLHILNSNQFDITRPNLEKVYSCC